MNGFKRRNTQREDASAFSIFKKIPAEYTVTADSQVMLDIIRNSELESRIRLLKIVTKAKEITEVRITCFSLRILAFARSPAIKPIIP